MGRCWGPFTNAYIVESHMWLASYHRNQKRNWNYVLLPLADYESQGAVLDHGKIVTTLMIVCFLILRQEASC